MQMKAKACKGDWYEKKKSPFSNANIMSFLTYDMQNWVDRWCYAKLHTLGDSKQEQPKSKETG